MYRPFPISFTAIFAVSLISLPGAHAALEAKGEAAKPIPPASSGTVELEEIKPTLNIDVKTSQSRLFKTKSKILRVAVSDPAVAEPVVVSEREFMILGKAPGNVSIFVWCQKPSG